MLKIRTILIAALLIATLSLAANARASASTFFALNSQPGDFIGGGITQTFTAADGTFSVRPVFNGGVNVSFNTANFSSFWSLSFGPLSGQTLVANQEYEGAQRFAFHSPTKPGIEIFGDGRGCNTITGRFLVSDITFASDGSVQTLAVDFEQHCEGAPPALFGSVRFNSSVAVEPRVSVAGATALKGNVGTSDATVTLSLCLPSPGAVSVDFHTANGTAVSGTDYRSSSGTVTFQPGTTSATITIPIRGDRFARGDKAFQVLLKNSQGAPIADGAGTIVILDPNVPLTVLSMYGQPGDFINPGQLVLTTADASFTSSRNFDQGVSLFVQSADSRNLDFAGPTSTTLTPGDYENAQRFPFQASGTPGLSVAGAGRGCNTVSGRFVVLEASYAANGDVQKFGADFEQHCEGGTPALFGSIRVNSNLRQLSVSNAVVDDEDDLQAVFTVTLNPASDSTVLVNFATADGTALAGGDYIADAQMVTFLPGETQHRVTVRLIAQSLNAPKKQFFGQISAPSGAPIWIAQGSATLATLD
jgi:hypothetical protein